MKKLEELKEYQVESMEEEKGWTWRKYHHFIPSPYSWCL